MLLSGAFQAYRQRLGLEGIYAAEAVAIAAAIHPEFVETEALPVDVEVEGALTYGATVVDRRPRTLDRPNMDVAVDIDAKSVVNFIQEGLSRGF
jgi:purine nucleosidase